VSAPIFYIDRSTIREGAREEVARGVENRVDFIQEEEPQLIAFDFYIDAEGRNMTVVSVHPDADSLTYHLEVGVLPLAGSPI